MATIVHASLIAAGALLAPSTSEDPTRPIELVAATGPAGTEIKVIGHAAAAKQARYTVEIADANGNRSTQRGTAHLQPGREAVLATIRLGSASNGSWRATLHVETESGAAYTLTYPG